MNKLCASRIRSLTSGSSNPKRIAASNAGCMRKYALAVVLFLAFGSPVLTRDDGRHANDPLKYWFDHLSSSNGMCCSFADGLSVNDVDWDMQNSHYRVLLHGEWIIVPDFSGRQRTEPLWSGGRLAQLRQRR